VSARGEFFGSRRRASSSVRELMEAANPPYGSEAVKREGHLTPRNVLSSLVLGSRWIPHASRLMRQNALGTRLTTLNDVHGVRFLADYSRALQCRHRPSVASPLPAATKPTQSGTEPNRVWLRSPAACSRLGLAAATRGVVREPYPLMEHQLLPNPPVNGDTRMPAVHAVSRAVRCDPIPARKPVASILRPVL